MTDVFETVENARPEVAPIPPDARRRIREELFHDGRRTPDATAQAAMVVPWQKRRRARQVVVTAGILLLGGLGALLYLESQDDEETLSSDSIPATSTTIAPASADTGELPVRFTPLVLAAPPEGYRLHWARYQGDRPASTVGLARYVGADGDPEIAVYLRPNGDLYRNKPAEGTPTWKVKGRRLIAEPASGLCNESNCGVNVQWDDDTAVSVSWVNWDGSSLNGVVTHDRLVELVRGLTERRHVWEPGSISPDDPTWDMPTPESAPLILPGEEATTVSAEHVPPWPGSSTAAIRAPDGSVLTIQEGDGGPTSFDEADLERQGAVAVVPPAGPKKRPLEYQVEVICGFTHVADEPGSAVLRPVMRRLLDSMTVDRGEVTVELRPGWERIDAGPNAAIYVLDFTTAIGGDEIEVRLVQSPGGVLSTLLYGRGPFSEVEFAGTEAWREKTDTNEMRIIGERAGHPYEIRARGVTLKELEAVFEGLQPSALATWESRWGTSAPATISSDCPQQPFLVVERASAKSS